MTRIALLIVGLCAAGSVEAGDLRARLDRLELEAELLRRAAPNRAHARADIERDLRLIEALDAPFLGVRREQNGVLLRRVERALRGAPSQRAGLPRRGFNRRTRLIDTSIPEVSVGLDALE